MTESAQDMKDAVRGRYASAALQVLQPRAPASAAPCCDDSCCGVQASDPVTGNLYTPEEIAALPEEVVAASLGCGNPTALIDLHAGDVVLDLGSGGGIDVLLSARRVGPAGKAFGLDMTDEMLALARQNAERAGATNVEFLKGEIEDIPLPDASVDVVISNCVINLSSDKAKVIREAFRVLRPGGRFAISDVVVEGPVPADLRRQVELWVGCMAGALERQDYLAYLLDAGFVDVDVEATGYHRVDEAPDSALASWVASQPESERERLNRSFFSAFVRARKPVA